MSTRLVLKLIARCFEREVKVSWCPCTKSCGSWFSCFLRDRYHLNQPLTYLNQSMTWAAGLMNIKLKRFVFTRFFPLLISSFWWKSHTKSWQELGNVNQVKPDQILSQAASKHLSPGLRKGGGGIFASDNLSQVYEAVPGQYNPLNGRSLQCLESDIKCPLPSQCRAYQYPWHGVLRPPRGVMMDFMSHISHVSGYLE